MRIAQVAPLYESVPPKLYGGTERVVSSLTEELVRMGHEVVLYASGDSETSAELRPVSACGLRLAPGPTLELVQHVLLLEQVLRDADEFDIIHFHIDYLHFPLARRMATPHLTTMHGRLDLPDLLPLFHEFREIPVVSISSDQRRPIPWASWVGTVHHGLALDRLPLANGGGGYFAFLGRVSPEKGLDRAIHIAQRSGRPLKIAAKVDDYDRSYFETTIRPLLGLPGVELVGEIAESDKGQFLGEAAALLFPIDWPEPFGLVMIESLACGTPVIGFRRGSVPEILEDGETGFICDTVEQAVDAALRIETLSRRRCRQAFEERFSARRMARDYLAVFDQLLAARTLAGPPLGVWDEGDHRHR